MTNFPPCPLSNLSLLSLSRFSLFASPAAPATTVARGAASPASKPLETASEQSPRPLGGRGSGARTLVVLTSRALATGDGGHGRRLGVHLAKAATSHSRGHGHEVQATCLTTAESTEMRCSSPLTRYPFTRTSSPARKSERSLAEVHRINVLFPASVPVQIQQPRSDFHGCSTSLICHPGALMYRPRYRS